MVRADTAIDKTNGTPPTTPETQADADRNVHRAADIALVDPVVVSIQSQVAWGHVGNDAAVFPLQVNGVEVVAVPTTLLSNHPGYPTMRGRFVEPALVADLLDGLRERRVPEHATGIVSGYLGDPATAPLVASFVRDAKARNPRLRYVCDPVMGDTGGIYVDPALPERFRDVLLPLADAITPNLFEFELLTGARVTSLGTLLGAGSRLHAGGIDAVIVTSAALPDTPADAVDVYALTPEGAWRVRSPRVPVTLVGSGDVLTALFAARWLRDGDAAAATSHAVSGLHAAIRVTAEAGVPELRLVAAAAELAAPSLVFPAERVDR